MVLFCVYMRFLLPNDLAKHGKIFESRLLTSQYLREVRRMINDDVFCTALPEWARIGLLTTSLNQSVKLKPAVSDRLHVFLLTPFLLRPQDPRLMMTLAPFSSIPCHLRNQCRQLGFQGRVRQIWSSLRPLDDRALELPGNIVPT